MPPTTANINTFERRTTVSAETPNDSWTALRYVAAGGRIVLGVIMLWAFVDKLFGLGYSTKAASSWLSGGSPTNGFLAHTTSWASGFYHAIAGNVVTDSLFMIALAAIGVSLILGVGMRIAGVSGAILMLLMYGAATLGVTGTTNPIVDDHIVYTLMFAAFAFYPVVGNTLGFGKVWQNSGLVKKFPFLA